MRPSPISRAGFRFPFGCLVILAVATGCTNESFRGESGSGFKVGIAVNLAAAVLTVLLAALLGYVVWRRSSKR